GDARTDLRGASVRMRCCPVHRRTPPGAARTGMPEGQSDRRMTWVLVACANCGAHHRLDATLITLTVDLTEDRASVRYPCTLCGVLSRTADLAAETQRMLL